MNLPQWLDEYLLDSGPGAYETLEPRLRAALKSQIAMLHRYYGEFEGRESRSRDWLGRELRAESAPADWALFLLDRDYASPSGLLAALMPAVLAGVEEILVCLADAAKKNNLELSLPISAALELVGVEQVWSLNPSECSNLFEHLRGQAGGVGQGNGAVVFLGDNFLDKLALDALRQGCSCKCLPGRVRIAVSQNCPADLDLLRWAQPQAEIVRVSRNQPAIGCLARLGAARGALPGALETALRLQPGNEAFWIWPDLTPEFFRRQAAGIFNL